MTNHGKEITLYGYGENMQRWFAHITVIPCNLKCIKIFCQPDDYFYTTSWTRRYIRKFINTTFEIITTDELDRNLLQFGFEYIQKLRQQFMFEDVGIWNLLNRDFKNICRVLGNNALQRANIEEDRIRESKEAET